MSAHTTTLKCLAAATLLSLSVQVATACDDADEEMTMAAAYDAGKVAQSQASPPTPAAQTAAPPAASGTGITSVTPQVTATAQR